MSDAFVAEIRMFSGNFPPRGWAFCNGQILPISQNTALFSLLGTNYGGDGKSNFGLPNLQDRFPIAWGHGPGLADRQIGETGGVAAVTLASNEMPAHTHPLNGTAAPTTGTPGDGVMLAPVGNGALAYRIPSSPQPMAPQTLAPAGGSQPHNNLQPFLAVSFIIALQGIFPPRS
jgi:microcystin-dependent protein